MEGSKKLSQGFIILRHVNNELTNNYWIHCYDCIRKLYKENIILIIDDNSNYKFITNKQLYNTIIINSEYPGRGELLPYYYYLHNKLFDIAVIIHDSVFINKYINFNVENYQLIWDFNHIFDNTGREEKLIKLFNDPTLNEFYQTKELWNGCFGCMTIINHDYLVFINNKYSIRLLLNHILNRSDRCCFERIIACLLQKNIKNKPLLGNIHSYMPWGIRYDQKDNYKYLPFVKVWTGR